MRYINFITKEYINFSFILITPSSNKKLRISKLDDVKANCSATKI